MTTEELNVIVERHITDLRETLSIKGAEYSLTPDRLKNFKDAAEFLECTPEEALFGFVAKHIIALKDFIKHETYSRKQIDEKIGDIICYMVLLDGLITERGI